MGPCVVLAALLGLSSCVNLGPDYHQPELGIQVPSAYQNVPVEKTTPELEDQWWRVFNDTELNELVEETLRNNWDLKRATAAVLEVRAQLVQSRADRLPTLDLDMSGQRRQRPIIGIIPDRSFTTTSSIYTLSLPATFELDLWGRLAKAEEAVRADLMRAEDNRRTVAQSVVAETISLYLQMESFEREIQVTERLIKTLRRSLTLVESRYKRGLTSILDVRQARRTLANAESLLPTLRQGVGTAQQQLAVLLGRYPETRPPRFQPEDYYKRLDPVPPGLPSELLLRRPDVRAAEAQLVALNAEVGVAKASRFPRIALTTNYGYSSADLNQLFQPQAELWSIAFDIGQPLFDAGKLRARQKAAEARYQQGIAEYARTVLTAFAEVESAFLTREEQLKRRDHVVNFLVEALAAERVAESRYARGLVDYLTVLDAQRTRFQAESDLVEVDFVLLNNRVNLHRALGGGWADPGPVLLE
ncbi:MAG: efflux transporter outer membrane subunit [Deltaproteobacteria bacterium]|nr:MAG: efflux transporter outer membrane subunit [Deltaproteobacteria bacterium]